MSVTAPARPSALPRSEPDAPRVLHVVLSLNPGGAERLVIDLSRRSRPEFTPAVCCLDERGAWADELDDAGIPVFVLGREPGFHPGLGRRIAALAGQVGASVLHCHQYTPFVYGCLAKLARPSLQVVFTEHGRLAGATISSKRKLANAVLGRFPGHFFAVCQELRRFLVAEGFPPGRLGVLYNGIDPGDAAGADSRSRARHELSLGADDFVIGSVGRLDPVKDFPTLIAAFAAVAKPTRTGSGTSGLDEAARLVPEAALPQLVVIGDGPEREALRRAVSSTGIADRVRFPGARSDARALMGAFDVYVNSSTYEGVSLTIIEAMAAALPVIATRVGGTPEVVEDGSNGILVPAGDVERLTSALRELRDSPERARTLGRFGRQTVEERFRFDTMLEAYAKAYRNEVTS